MAFQVDGAELTKLVECNICLHSLVAPKQLLCGHTFCKACLDDLLKFNENGNAIIECPMKCDKVTSIVEDKTTESLQTNYSLTGILDLVHKHAKCVESDEQKSKKLCQQSMECQQPASRSCSQCSLKSCAKCWSSHSCKEDLYTAISFDDKSDAMQPLCLKHMSIASDVCIRCHNLFVCVYCANRDHKNHEKKSISEFGISTKNSFDCHIQSLQAAKEVFQKLSQTYDAAFEDIENNRKTYVKEIEARKLYCLQKYLRFLNKVEKDLLNDFDENVAIFKTEITSAGLMRFPNERNINSSKFLQELETKSSYEIIAESKKIEETFKELELLPISLPSIEISVEEMNRSLCLKEPYGKIGISMTKVNFDDLNSINIVKFHIKKLERLVNSAQLECDLVSCVGNLSISRRRSRFRRGSFLR